MSITCALRGCGVNNKIVAVVNVVGVIVVVFGVYTGNYMHKIVICLSVGFVCICQMYTNQHSMSAKSLRYISHI